MVVNYTPKLIPLFCYGSNNIEQLRKRVENPSLISRPCILPFYRRIFAGNVKECKGGVASLVYINNEKVDCRGTYVLLTKEELKKMDTFEGTNSDDPYNSNPFKNVYRREYVKVTLSNGMKINAITYIKNANDWIAYPSNDYLNACYQNIKPFFNDLDGNNSIMVYDNNGGLHGKYFG